MVHRKVTFSSLGTQGASLWPCHSPLGHWGTTESPVPWPTCTTGLPTARPTYNVHERQQVLLHVFLPVELDHRVIHTQQDLNVVVIVGGVSAGPAPRAVDPFLQDAQGMAKAVQAAHRGPWKDRGQVYSSQLPRDTEAAGRNPSLMPA